MAVNKSGVVRVLLKCLDLAVYPSEVVVAVGECRAADYTHYIDHRADNMEAHGRSHHYGHYGQCPYKFRSTQKLVRNVRTS